jgi:hypothetical protein
LGGCEKRELRAGLVAIDYYQKYDTIIDVMNFSAEITEEYTSNGVVDHDRLADDINENPQLAQRCAIDQRSQWEEAVKREDKDGAVVFGTNAEILNAIYLSARPDAERDAFDRLVSPDAARRPAEWRDLLVESIDAAKPVAIDAAKSVGSAVLDVIAQKPYHPAVKFGAGFVSDMLRVKR